MTRVLKITSIVCFWVFDFGYAAYRSYHDIDSGYSVVAHIGGTVTGLLLGFIVLKDVKMQRWELLLKVVRGLLFLFLIFFFKGGRNCGRLPALPSSFSSSVSLLGST